MAAERGAPRKHDRDDLLFRLLAYIAETDVPIVSEFAYLNGLHRQQLYDMPELSDALKMCITKKEAQLEKGALSGELNPAMSIFSLKQMGWRDASSLDLNPGGEPIKVTRVELVGPQTTCGG